VNPVKRRTSTVKRFTIKFPAAVVLFSALATCNAFAGGIGAEMPGPGVFALLALGVVGAIGISRLRK
jgi:hypothetical protein